MWVEDTDEKKKRERNQQSTQLAVCIVYEIGTQFGKVPNHRDLSSVYVFQPTIMHMHNDID